MASPAAIPRVAVVGGGIAGTLASLVLRNRGLHPILIDRGRDVGGRLRGSPRSKLGVDVDAGAQFIRSSDMRFETVLRMLEREGLLAKWNGRFGLLGNQGGGFLPASIVGQATAMGKAAANNNNDNDDDDNNGEKADATGPTDSGDFCSFVSQHRDEVPVYVGMPDNVSLCPEICRLASIEKIIQTQVLKAEPKQDGGWELQLDGEMTAGSMSFDALILTSHNASMAAEAVQTIIDRESQAINNQPEQGISSSSNTDEDTTKAHTILMNRLSNLVKDLNSARESKKPIFTWSGRFPANAPSLPFDAASVPGSHLIQYLVRESSKPGRRRSSSNQSEEDGEIWTAISTSALAQDILKRHQGQEASEEANSIMSKAVSDLLFQQQKSQSYDATDGSAVQWGSGFTTRSLGLKEDSIFLNPWRLAIAGDFIRDAHPTPLEAAALSGLEAGERVAAMFQAMEEARVSPPQ
eukprot:scaffold5939_cov111-Cylindrotheca_fusiformis.AAC.5